MKNPIERKEFIRFKDIPLNETSGVYDGDLGKLRDEPGVCCFDCIKTGNSFRIILPSIDTGPLYDIQGFIWRVEKGEMPCYLISGVQVGFGTYGEPAVKDVEIIGKLTIVDKTTPPPEFKMDRRNPQLIAPWIKIEENI